MNKQKTFTHHQLPDVRPGTVVEVVRTPDDNTDEIGKKMIRTNDDEHPFVTIADGSLWGCALAGYRFKTVKA